MDKKNERPDIYILPPNFMDVSTVFSGMFKLRNAIEAAVVVVLIGLPILQLSVSLTTKIIILCLTALPLGLFALIGIDGESLTSFVYNFFVFLRHRRVLHRNDIPARVKKGLLSKKPKVPKEKKKSRSKPKKSKQKKSKKPKRKKENGKENSRAKKQKSLLIEDFLPIDKVENGIVYTKDGRYIKILEVEPINFLLRSAREQRNIIYSFASYLKISPVKIQFKAITKKADINRHLGTIEQEMQVEENEKCRELQQDYVNLIKKIGSREAVSRRFFIIFEYEPFALNRKNNENEVIAALKTAERTARTYMQQCGNEIKTPENEDEFVIDALYSILHRGALSEKTLGVRAQEVIRKYIAQGNTDALNSIPANEFIAPQEIDFTHSNYIIIDGIYYAYMFIPSDGYKSQVCAGWMSLLINAGEGIDTDIFLMKQPKDRIQNKLGQQIRINRSKIKDASDTNSDFDDLDSAIQSGYFLKNGLSNSEDFYYLSTLITITSDNLRELEWRVNEMRKLLISQDMTVSQCNFLQEAAFVSTLPLANLNKKLYERSRRNVLTSGAASCYPFVSYEICDDNGILLGVNKHNNSLVITDIFNSKVYKNANISIMGTSGAGKTFTLQLMALRMRRRNIQVFIIAPLKGHEFYRACKNINGEFIQISPASQNCINIMEIRPVDNTNSELIDGSSVEKSELASKIQRLHIFFSLLIPDMSHEERQLLDDAMIKCYFEKGITHNNESLTDPETGSYKQMPILGDLYVILKKSPETKRMSNILNRLVNGSAKSFNQQTNVDLSNKYTVLDISELTGDLLTVGMYVALDYVWDKCKEDRTVEKAVFIDEVWQLIGASSNKLAADFVLEVFKIIRGYGGSAVCATQDLNDFFALDGGKFGRGIINNSKTKIILNLEDEEAQRVQEVLKLSETEVMNITHFGRGNGLISTNNNNVTVQFKASELEKELITTDRNELQAILQKHAAQNG